MYRIIIADDEEYIRELLAKNMNQSEHDFEVVGTAENGIQALELIKEKKPDILITDICMPMMDGLVLIKELKAREYPVKTVIISGYDDFSYAKQALTLGVTDYLLKPFLPDEMYGVLNKIKDELESQKRLMSNIKDLQNQLEDNQMIVQENFLRKLLLDSLKPEEAGEEARRAGVSLEAGQYAAGVLRIQSSLEEQNDGIKNFLAMVKDEYFSKEICSFAVSFNDRQIAMVFFGTYRNPQTFVRAIKEGITAINYSLEKYYDLGLYCMLGGVCGHWEELSASYKQALSVWRGSLNPTKPLVCYEDELKERKESQERPVELESQLLMNIQMGRMEKALDNLDEILKHYGALNVQLSDFVSISLVELVFHISATLSKAGGGQPRVWEDENIVEYLRDHFTYGSLWDAKNTLEDYVKKCCEQFQNVNEKQGDRIVFHVKELIEKNIGNEEFSLEAASAQLFFSHNYVRQIFKQVSGESFMEYLIRRRMETARELLMNPLMKIQDISVLTGYSNQRYFASCFKKYFGCTPTEYRMEHGQIKDV